MPHATETIKWDNNLVFTIDAKMFAIAALDPGAVWLSFKVTPEGFTELTERPGIRPAPYLARAHWVSLETPGAMLRSELERCLRGSYQLVFDKLPKKRRLVLG
ncbi:MAG: MmcQ/YjbR family DNA-binding protein [Acidobacteria bacterium]|nr:MmcQ/YjbR family DNA-binding protein [Acidobacteriota bacterium]